MQAQKSTVHGTVPLSLDELRSRADALFAAVDSSRRPVWNASRTRLTYGESSGGITRTTVVCLMPNGNTTDFELTFTQTSALPRLAGMQTVLDAMVKSGCRKLLALIGTEATALRTGPSPRNVEIS